LDERNWKMYSGSAPQQSQPLTGFSPQAQTTVTTI